MAIMKAITCLLLAVVVGCSGRVHFAHNRTSDLHDVQITDWVLAAHGSTRMRANGQGNDWTAKFHLEGFHYPMFAVPFGEGPVQAAGVNHRTSDNHIHVPILGNVSCPGGSLEPAGGAEHYWCPPMVWEIDGNTGETVRVYNLTKYSKNFESVLRYTSDGYPFIALSAEQSPPIVILDRNSSQVLSQFSGGPEIRPQLLQITNTNPQQIMWSSFGGNAAMDINGHAVVNNTYVVTADTSTIIFSTDGKSIYNNAFYDQEVDVGIYKFPLPLTAHLQQDYSIDGCDTRPWRMASDSNDNLYTHCNVLQSFDKAGKTRWSSGDHGYFFITLTDAEDVVFIGDGPSFSGIDPENGSVLWTIPKTAFNGTVLVSAQPWAPRYPIPLSDGSIAVMVLDGDGYSIVRLNSRSGKIMDGKVTFNIQPEMLTADSSNNVYAFGREDGFLTVQRKALGNSA